MVCLKQDTEIGSLFFHVRGDKDLKLCCRPCGLWGKDKLFKDFRRSQRGQLAQLLPISPPQIFIYLFIYLFLRNKTIMSFPGIRQSSPHMVVTKLKRDKIMSFT